MVATGLSSSYVAVVAACAASAGAHAALVPQHLDHEPRLGVAFVAATVVLLAIVGAMVCRPASAAASDAAALVLAALLVAYALSVTAGVPWLGSEREDVDLVGLSTTSVEAFGLLFSIHLIQPLGGRRPLPRKEAPR